LPDDATSLTLRGTTPDASFLPVHQRVFKARNAHAASVTDRFGLLSIVVIVRIEDARFEPTTGS
jgi:hypothetical protein